MNNREQAKAEIRFYKRFLDELDAAMSRKTTYTNLKNITARFGLLTKVLDDFIREEIITTDKERTQSCFRLNEAMDNVLFYFSFSDEPDYEWADNLRIGLHQHIARVLYQRAEQAEIIGELIAEDEHLSKRCLQCGYPVLDKRIDAKYCCESCRKKASAIRRERATVYPQTEEKKIEKRQWWFFLIGK